ncbi:MAG: porin family protein, partial [Tsuneonella sp.]
MKNIVFAATLPLVMLASPAIAQDETQDMGGFYTGAIVGIDSVRLSDGVDSGSESDIGFGAVVGYDYDLGQAVVGIEAEWADSGVSAGVTDVFTAGDEVRLSAGRDLYVGGRLGF